MRAAKPVIPLLAILLSLLVHPAEARADAGDAPYSAVVDARHGGAEGARVGGVPTFRAIGGALRAAPAGEAPYTVFVRDGRYREKLSVDRANVRLVGESREGTVLTYDAAAGHPSPGGGTWGTRGSFTLRIAAPGFRLERMTVENAFAYMENHRKAQGDSTRLVGSQGVAVLTDSASDRAVFRDCVIRGHQDTLFADQGRSYFHRCAVLGSVDFIFGAGQAVFDDSDIVSLDRGEAEINGYVAAPSTPLSRPYGLVFVRSRLRKESPSMRAGTVMLGRPWHPRADPQAVGSAVFIECEMDDHVAARGWTRMAGTSAEGVRTWFEPEAARFFEYRSTGPGAVSSPSRRVLTDAEAAWYAPAQVLRGWDPDAQ